MMHIAVALHDPDGSYSQNLGACLCSLFANSASPMTVHLLHTRTLTFENKNKFLALGNKFGREISFIDVEDSLTELRLTQHPSLAYFSPATISRLFLSRILPDVSRVLYLDADMIVDIDIEELWNIDLQGYPLGAVPDLGIVRAKYVVPIDQTCDGWANGALAKWQQLGLDLDTYFNAGTLLLDLNLIRQHHLFEQVLTFLENNTNLPCPDQDALNAVFRNNYLPLPFRFNVMISLYPTWCAGPCIWHFTGLKPWENLYSPRKDRYDLYLGHTPWGAPQKRSPKYAPVAYICFNRPQTVIQSIERLANATLADQTDLHLFVDAPRNESDVSGVQQVLNICCSDEVVNKFLSVTLHQQNQNIGACESNRNAVKTMCSLYDRFIMLEDDVLFSKSALQYFNKALTQYRDVPTVFTVSAWRPPTMEIPDNYPWDAFFSPRSLIWGWASWADRMAKVDWEARNVSEFEKHPQLIRAFNRGGPDMSPMLSSTVRAPQMGWDIVMDFSRFKYGGVSLVPRKPFAKNIGVDISSVGSASVNIDGQWIEDNVESLNLPDFINCDPQLEMELYNAFCTITGMPVSTVSRMSGISSVTPHERCAKSEMKLFR